MCPSCEKEVRPTGFLTGLQDLLACRIHLKRDHGIYKATDQMAEIRAEQDSEGMKGGDIIFIDVDKEERWLAP